jgi:hypothetical protein
MSEPDEIAKRIAQAVEQLILLLRACMTSHMVQVPLNVIDDGT